MNKEKYTLVGVDGNAYAIMGYVMRAMRREGKSKEEIEAYRYDATKSDYNELICVSCEMLDKLNNNI